LGTDAETFAQLARANFGAALRAYRHSTISPYASERVLEELKLAGEPKALDTMVNVHVLGTSSAALAEIRTDVDDSIITWISSRDSEITTVSFDCSEPGMALLQADIRYIPKPDIERVLRLYRQVALSLTDGDDMSPRKLANKLFEEM
ncbi:MAG: hypothetical protein ACTHLT_12550, partial [Devosia sp.]